MDLEMLNKARRVLDRIVGYSISNSLEKRQKGIICWTCAIWCFEASLIVKTKFMLFNPEEYWTIDATFKKGARNFKQALWYKWQENETLLSTMMSKNVLSQIRMMNLPWKVLRKGTPSVMLRYLILHHLCSKTLLIKSISELANYDGRSTTLRRNQYRFWCARFDYLYAYRFYSYY